MRPTALLILFATVMLTSSLARLPAQECAIAIA